MIMVVNNDVASAENVKTLIQFMDAPHVCSSTPGRWLQKVGERRLEAVFLGPNLSSYELETVVGEVGELDPNVPIVMLNSDAVEW